MTFDPYTYEEAAWEAGQYKAELVMNRLVSKELQVELGMAMKMFFFKKFHSPFHSIFQSSIDP